MRARSSARSGFPSTGARRRSTADALRHAEAAAQDGGGGGSRGRGAVRLPCQVSAVGEPFIKESRRRRQRQWRWLYNNETRRPRSRGEIGAASSAAEEPCAASPGIANEVLAHRGGGAPTRIEGVAGDRVGGRASEAPRGPRCTAASLLQPHPSRSSGGGSALDTGTSRVASRRRSRTPRSVGPRARTCAHGCALRMASKGLVLPSPRYAYLPCPLHEPGKSSPLSPPPPSPASVACLRRLPPSPASFPSMKSSMKN
jgi:hypothetical protein